MRRQWKWYVVMLVSGALAILESGCGAGGLLGDRGAVSGTVRDTKGHGIAGAFVTAGGVRGWTDSGGGFELGNVPVGQRDVAASHPNYMNAGEGQRAVTVAKDSTVGQVDLVLVPRVVSGVHLYDLVPTHAQGWGWWAYGVPEAVPQLGLNGTSYLHGMRASVVADGDQGIQRYNLGKLFVALTTRVGVPDDFGDVTAEVEFVFRGDGVQLYRSPTLKVGRTADVTLNLTGVLTLDVVAFAVNGRRADVGWADHMLTPKAGLRAEGGAPRLR